MTRITSKTTEIYIRICQKPLFSDVVMRHLHSHTMELAKNYALYHSGEQQSRKQFIGFLEKFYHKIFFLIFIEYLNVN